MNQEELEQLLMLDLSERDELFVKTYYEKTKDLNDDEYYTSQISYEEDMWRCANTEKKIAYEDGLEQGIEKVILKGKKELLIETVKKMKESNLPLEQIAQITNMSISEIEKI